MAEKAGGIILFAQSGRMFTSLRVLLKSLFPLVQIEQAEDKQTLMPLLSVNQPWLILIDADLPENEGWHMAGMAKQMYPYHHFMLMTHHVRQNDLAHKAGLDTILLEGMTSARLFTGIGHFLRD